MPKLYFYDTGLACALLGINKQSQLTSHPIRGSLFENMVVVEILKHLHNNGRNERLCFWRNHTGWEIDLLIDTGSYTIPVEIKAGQTIQSDFFRNLSYWQQLSNVEKGFLIYGGNEPQIRSGGVKVLPWYRSTDALEML